ncbi:MAG: beta-galactosidase [Candidatus Sumerlaeota bacterium]|nr:beta-galactosidase [Candidatus Sumerlaeota bacterium]
MILLLCFAFSASAAESAAPLALADFSKNFDISSIKTVDGKVALSGEGAERRLRVELGHANEWPGITIKAPSGKWDLSHYQTVSFEAKNPGATPVTICLRVDNPGADGTKNCVTASAQIKPNSKATVMARLCLTPWVFDKPLTLIGMRGTPGVTGTLDTANITQLLVFVTRPQEDYQFEIGAITASGQVEYLKSEGFLPFIDEMGQYIHRDWPGKAHSVNELSERAKAEDKELNTLPAPKDRDQYGGWSAGPKLQATGFFRPEKRDGKWWLVDPEGRLFWSHGIDCVGFHSVTPISDRENYFKGLPAEGSALARFYGKGAWAPHGYYKDHSPYRQFNFVGANIARKYGDGAEDKFSDVTHRRFHSWGLNTIANWSESKIYLKRKTPYTATLGSNAPSIEGSSGYWGKFPDPFDPAFRKGIRNRIAQEKGRSAGDPWCLGYFVDNEMSWGTDGLSLALAALSSPAEQAAKKAFIADLKTKYETIEKLNAAWKASHASWDALAQSREAPDKARAKEDLHGFYSRLAEMYFKTNAEELKAGAPNQLYLGCRFAWNNDWATSAAAKYCDVISFNKYDYSVESVRLPGGVDKPVVIGEFHFGALDRGMFHTGLKSAKDQDERAQCYENYVRGALRNPLIVGTHWFQYQDQATTGRPDGENYQIGFVDICDTPYPEIVAASRRVGSEMYEVRSKGQ